LAHHIKIDIHVAVNHNKFFWSRQHMLHVSVSTDCPETLTFYRGADKSLARPTSPCIFYGENISFDASLGTYINSTNIPPIVIINRIYETQNLLSL